MSVFALFSLLQSRQSPLSTGFAAGLTPNDGARQGQKTRIVTSILTHRISYPTHCAATLTILDLSQIFLLIFKFNTIPNLLIGKPYHLRNVGNR